MIFHFGEFTLDADNFELTRGKTSMPMQPRVFDLLAYLVRRAGAVVSKAELSREVWQGAAVTKDSLPHAVMAARAALADDPADPQFIATVRGRGYRFIAPVTMGPSPARRPPVSARDGDLAALLSLATPRASVGWVALVAGESGVGKSDLLKAFTAACPLTVLHVAPLRGSPTPPLFLATELARELGRVEGLASTDALDQVGDESPRAVMQLVDRVALRSNRGPLVVVVDDLHLIDRASVPLLELLARRVTTHRIGLVLTHRPSATATSAAAALVSELATSPLATALALEPFSVVEIRRRLADLLGFEPSDALATEVHRATEGNGRLVTLLSRSASPRSGVIDVSLAESPRELLAGAWTAELGAAGGALRSLLAVASVLGETFSQRDVEALFGEGDLSDLLDAAQGRRFLADAGPGRYRFAPPLLRALAYADLGPAARARLHRRAETLPVAEHEALRPSDVRAVLDEAPERRRSGP